MRRSLAARLPDFPWDLLVDAKQKALAHSGGIVDLSIGTPVDPTPQMARDALSQAANSPGYPTAIGSPEVREAAAAYLCRRWGVPNVGAAEVLALIGSKEFVAALPTQLGLSAEDSVVIPRLAYPTYSVGVQVAGCREIACDDPAELGDESPALIWLNSPSNPSGATMSPDRMREWVAYARRCGSIVAADECYGEFGWDTEPVSILHPDICGGTHEGLLAVLSLSKRSNLAGYRAGFVAGDRTLINELGQVRKHLGMMMPMPVQHAMTAMLADQDHVERQRARYLGRRHRLGDALHASGWRIDHSEAGLYLWTTRGEDCLTSVDRLAELGILVAPGNFYGAPGAQHVRIALTATDERIEAAAARLTA